jgi:predicted transcriptional regulator of viral defense system
VVTAVAPVHPAGISQRNRDCVERLHRGTISPFDVAEAARLLDLDTASASRLVGYLARRGWLSRVRRGLYVAVPLDARRSGEWIEDPWIVAHRVFAPSYIGGWSACEHWDLTEQLFRTVLVVTGKKVRRQEVELQGVHFWVTSRPVDHLFGTVGVWRTGVRVEVSDPSRTIIDMLDDPRLGGGIRNVADVLREYLSSEHRKDDLLADYGDRLGNRTVFKRLGFLLERLGADADDLVEACLARRSAGLTKLDPSVKTNGRITGRWGLRVNVSVNRTGDE